MWCYGIYYVDYKVCRVMCSILKVLSELENVPLSLKRTRIISRYSTPIRSMMGHTILVKSQGVLPNLFRQGV